MCALRTGGTEREIDGVRSLDTAHDPDSSLVACSHSPVLSAFRTEPLWWAAEKAPVSALA